MEDEKGPDSKVVLSPVKPDGSAMHELTAPVRDEIAGYFQKYKLGQPGKFSKVHGWGSIADARDYLTTARAFFRQCRKHAGGSCRID
jgi:inorganic pyrophosphatase